MCQVPEQMWNFVTKKSPIYGISRVLFLRSWLWKYFLGYFPALLMKVLSKCQDFHRYTLRTALLCKWCCFVVMLCWLLDTVCATVLSKLATHHKDRAVRYQCQSKHSLRLKSGGNGVIGTMVFLTHTVINHHVINCSMHMYLYSGPS